MVRRAFAAVTIAALGLGGVASAALLSAPPAPPSTPAAPTTAATDTTSTDSSVLVLTGHGYGHGIGMGQWGAYGYALHGWSAARILAHYYTGTTLGQDTTKVVRVLLADGEATAAVGSSAPWKLIDAAGTRLKLPAGPLTVSASLELGGRKLVSPLTLRPGREPLELGGVAYHGSLVLLSDGKALQVVNDVGMQDYLDGVVAEEVPPGWPPAALEAQAIASRSFVVSQLGTADVARPFDVYADGRSQVYGGIRAEAPATTAAVQATAHRVVLYQGKVALTYFSSSSGGETVSAAEANGTPIPYLVSVPDPWDVYSPNHDWGPVLMSSDAVGKALGLTSPLSGFELTMGASDHVASLTAVGTGQKVTMTGAQVRDALALRSSWFQLGWLALKAPPAAVRPGTVVELSGIAKGLVGITLESRTAGSGWEPVGRPVIPDAKGAFSIAVSPRVTTWYRLASGTVAAGSARVSVTTR
jgi:stage II sporulation protein D